MIAMMGKHEQAARIPAILEADAKIKAARALDGAAARERRERDAAKEREREALKQLLTAPLPEPCELEQMAIAVRNRAFKALDELPENQEDKLTSELYEFASTACRFMERLRWREQENATYKNGEPYRPLNVFLSPRLVNDDDVMIVRGADAIVGQGGVAVVPGDPPKVRGTRYLSGDHDVVFATREQWTSGLGDALDAERASVAKRGGDPDKESFLSLEGGARWDLTGIVRRTGSSMSTPKFVQGCHCPYALVRWELEVEARERPGIHGAPHNKSPLASVIGRRVSAARVNDVRGIDADDVRHAVQYWQHKLEKETQPDAAA